MNEAIYSKLKDIAHAQGLTTYSDIAPLAGLSMDVDKDRNEMSAILGEILSHEISNGRPLLTAVVIHKGNDNNPGEGFFAIASEFGKFNATRNSLQRVEFWIKCVGEAHSYWANTAL